MHKRHHPRTSAASEAVSQFMLHRHPDTSNMWVLVADTARARLFQLLPGARKLSEIECFDSPDAMIHATARDRLPRTQESFGSARHAIEPHTTQKEKSMDRFAHTLARELESRRLQQRYDRLILVAPPRFLGALHRCFDKPMRDCVVAEIESDLTTWPVERIFEHLSPKPVP